MSTPAQNKADTQSKEPSFAERVNTLAKDMQPNDKGEFEKPENVSDEVWYAATLERRRRDTQAEFTKTRQQNKALQAEKSTLLQKATADVKLELTPEQQEEMDDLKFSDPDEWRRKMNVLEQEAIQKAQAGLDEELKKVSTSSLEEEEIERRKEVLNQFSKVFPDFKLDDDVIANDIPPRITKKLEEGAISFEDYLHECYNYLKTGKVVADSSAPNTPNLNKYGGGDTPDKSAGKEDIVKSYASEVY